MEKLSSLLFVLNFISLLTIHTHINPMGGRLRQAFLRNKSAIKDTTIYGSVSSGISAVIFSVTKQQCQNLPDASKEEQEYAREQFRAIGVKDPASIKVKIEKQPSCYDNVVMIPELG